MKQKLLPQSIRKTIQPLYAQDGKGMEAIAHLRFFHAYGSNGVWYLAELDHDGGDTCFGWSEIFQDCGELGYLSEPLFDPVFPDPLGHVLACCY